MEFYVDQLIHATPEKVALVMFDPNKEPLWISTTKSVDVLTPGPVDVGTRVRREGGFITGPYHWTAEINIFEPGRRLVMDVIGSRMDARISYEVTMGAGGTVAIVHATSSVGEPLPGLVWSAKHNCQEDLKRLNSLVMHGHT